MKKKIVLIILLVIMMIVVLGITKNYANTNSSDYVYIYESTSEIYGGSEKEPISIPIPSGFQYRKGGDGYIVIRDRENLNLEYIWVPLDNLSQKETLIKEVYRKYEEEENKKYKSGVYDIIRNTQETILPEFKESIKEYKGFYVSVAELSYDGENNFYNKGRGMVDNSVTGTDEKGDYYRGTKYTYNEMTKKAESISKENNVVNSHLIYGVEWDAMVLWIANTNENYMDSEGNSISKILVENSTHVGKYRNNSELESTISASEVKSFNGIWGLGGNLAEVTQETYNNKYVTRGGSYNTTGEVSPIVSRDVTENLQKDDIGFRTALYITPELERKEIINESTDENNTSSNENSQDNTKEEKYIDSEQLDDLEYTEIPEGRGTADLDSNDRPKYRYVTFYDTMYYWYLQTDYSDTKKHEYWGRTIALDGCGLTSISTIISGKGNWHNPVKVRDRYRSYGFTDGTRGGGSMFGSDYYSKLEYTAKSYGLLSWKLQRAPTTDELVRHIRDGNNRTWIVCQNGGSPWTGGGHYVPVIRSY